MGTMHSIKYEEKEKNQILEKLCCEIDIKMPVLTSTTLKEGIKELCVAKLCQTIGITCDYNYKSEFFEFFSTITGQAVCDIMNLNLNIASDELRLFRYDNLNLVEYVKFLLNSEDYYEAFLDAFNFVDKYKYLKTQA